MAAPVSSKRPARPDRTSGHDPADDSARFRVVARTCRAPAAAKVVAPRRASGAAAAERWLLGRILRRLGNLPLCVELWDGRRVDSGEGPPLALVRIRDRATLLRLASNPGVAFGEGYAEGAIDVEGDLLALLEAAFRARWSATAGPAWWARLGQAIDWLRANTVRRSRRNVHHHYDITEDFYRLWLDDEMVYTCAYFADPATTLEEAQRAKMDYVCRKLRLRPGESVVEAGCGWGALALFMARNYGVRVRAYNLSHAQTAFARQRAEAEGLASRVEFIEDDYRSISGRYDAFVSVGMLEHVGRKQYRQLGKVIDRCLEPNGRGLIHSIGRVRPAGLDGWTERRIFPGAYPPSLKEMMGVFEPRGFSVLDVENLRAHYARTLEHWLSRYEAHKQQVAEMFDERFVRTWQLYLTGSIAGFTTGTLQLFQVVFARTAAAEVPWSRAWLYADRPESSRTVCRPATC